ncbi:VanZ family protein [Winogradskyella sp.]|uniref:VanZ family protein n=1 Tax=Winogradskyella sp. TaxID=1883156 RepID=UPI003F6B9562
MDKRILLFLAIVYTIALTVASLININGVPKLGFSFDDKIYHFLAYLLLSLLWVTYIKSHSKSFKVLITTVVLIVFGIVLELVQHPFNPNRTYDNLDLLANCFGVIVGMLIAVRIDIIKLK